MPAATSTQVSKIIHKNNCQITTHWDCQSKIATFHNMIILQDISQSQFASLHDCYHSSAYRNCNHLFVLSNHRQCINLVCTTVPMHTCYCHCATRIHHAILASITLPMHIRKDIQHMTTFIPLFTHIGNIIR